MLLLQFEVAMYSLSEGDKLTDQHEQLPADFT